MQQQERSRVNDELAEAQQVVHQQETALKAAQKALTSSLVNEATAEQMLKALEQMVVEMEQKRDQQAADHAESLELLESEHIQQMKDLEAELWDCADLRLHEVQVSELAVVYALAAARSNLIEPVHLIVC